jgi:hypothetical protein
MLWIKKLDSFLKKGIGHKEECTSVSRNDSIQKQLAYEKAVVLRGRLCACLPFTTRLFLDLF